MPFPEAFTSYTHALMGDDLYNRLLAAMDEPAPVSLRLNTAKGALKPEDSEPVGWCPEGYYLKERPAFTFDPLLHAGCYYVQEAASMFVAHALRHYLSGITSPLTAIDLCAAPGGKSTALLSALPEGSSLLSNEPVRPRAQILAENLSKWGNPRTFVTNNYPEELRKTGLTADVIVCDVPCSGEGMFRKDREAIGEWSPGNVEKCARLQREIVATAWQMLREGGLLAYSTCTFNARENEENIRWAMEELGARPLPVSIEPQWAITGSLLSGFNEPVYRFIPGTTRGEGLFFCLLRKGGELRGEPIKEKHRKERTKATKTADATAHCREWLHEPDSYTLVTEGDTVWAIPSDALYIYNNVRARTRLLKSGIALAQLKGKDLIPQQPLALTTALSRGAFPEVELSHEEAIAYLRRLQPTLPPTTPRGYVLTTYKGHPLGFVKHLGNRSNNLYPQEWKIRSSGYGHNHRGTETTESL